MGDVVYLPKPTLTPEQREHWNDQVEYWGDMVTFAQRQLEYAERQRENALRQLGMLGLERGLDN